MTLKIAITGQDGFIGYHLYNTIKYRFPSFKLVNFKKLITFENTVPEITGQIHLDEFLVDPFLSSQSNESKPFYIQDSIDLNLLVKVKKLTYKAFNSKNDD